MWEALSRAAVVTLTYVPWPKQVGMQGADCVKSGSLGSTEVKKPLECKVRRDKFECGYYETNGIIHYISRGCTADLVCGC